MRVFLRDIKERLPELEILNYSPDVSFSKFSHDTRELEADSLYSPIIGESFDGHEYIEKALSKGSTISLCEISKKDLVENISSPIILTNNIQVTLAEILDIFLEKVHKSAKIVAITGSTGKTTTREMISAVLEKKGQVLHSSTNINTLWGNAELLDDYNGEEYIVLEFGTDKKGEIEQQCKGIRPDIGVLLNIGFVHAGSLGVIENIYQEKKDLANFLREENRVLVLNIDDERLIRIEEEFNDKLTTYGRNKDSDIRIVETSLSKSGTYVKISHSGKEYGINLKILGNGYAYNTCATFCIGIEMGLDSANIIKSLEEYEGFDSRFQLIRISENIDLINDAYNANPTSMKMSIDTFYKLYKDEYDEKVLILGDMKELGEYTEKEHKKVGERVKELGLKKGNVYYFGEYFNYFGYGQRLSDLKDVVKVIKKYQNTRKKIIFLIKGSHGSNLYKLPELLFPSNISS